MLMRTLLCLTCAKLVPLNHHLFIKKVILGALSYYKPHISIAPLKNLSKYCWESVRHSRVAYGWKVFSDYKRIMMQTEYCLREKNPNMHLSCICVLRQRKIKPMLVMCKTVCQHQKWEKLRRLFKG